MKRRFELADLRIAECEQELARAQTEGALVLIEATLARETLQGGLATVVEVAHAVRDALAIPIDDHLDELGRDLAPP